MVKERLGAITMTKFLLRHTRPAFLVSGALVLHQEFASLLCWTERLRGFRSYIGSEWTLDTIIATFFFLFDHQLYYMATIVKMLRNFISNDSYTTNLVQWSAIGQRCDGASLLHLINTQYLIIRILS